MRKLKLAISCFALIAITACQPNTGSSPLFSEFEPAEFESYEQDVAVAAIRAPKSVIVCRSKECAPAKLSMSREYIYNSLLHLLQNNNHKTALICKADPASRTCTESYLSMPIKVGITPAYMYIDSVKITDVLVKKGNTKFDLILNYNVSYNGQVPDCGPAKTLMYVKNINNIIMEDIGYNCKMTTTGNTSIKTVFAIDYIDLDYGFIGGYYSIGASGPAYGGGTGYMLLRLPKDAYPLDPALEAPQPKQPKEAVPQAAEPVSVRPASRPIATTSHSAPQVDTFETQPASQELKKLDQGSGRFDNLPPQNDPNFINGVEVFPINK